jgi:hypothetical protein
MASVLFSLVFSAHPKTPSKQGHAAAWWNHNPVYDLCYIYVSHHKGRNCSYTDYTRLGTGRSSAGICMCFSWHSPPNEILNCPLQRKELISSIKPDESVILIIYITSHGPHSIKRFFDIREHRNSRYFVNRVVMYPLWMTFHFILKFHAGVTMFVGVVCCCLTSFILQR